MSAAANLKSVVHDMVLSEIWMSRLFSYNPEATCCK